MPESMKNMIYSQLFVKPAYPTKSFSGKTVIVTGSNVGLGKEAVRHFVRLDARKVIIAVRNVEAGEKAKQEIETSEQRPGTCEVWKLDLSSYDSVKAFASRASQLPRLDVLVENAGIAGGDFTLMEGHESTITVNVISTILLALLMLPKLKDQAKKFPAEPPIMTIVSSEVHSYTDFPESKADSIFEQLDKGENMAERYPVSKLMEVLTVRELAPRIANSGVVLNMLNPGLCHSELARNAGWGLYFMKLLLARSTEVGSRTLLAAASAGRESHGAYMSDGLVNNNGLSSFVRSEEGAAVQRKQWKEFSAILERIQPGVTAVA